MKRHGSLKLNLAKSGQWKSWDSQLQLHSWRPSPRPGLALRSSSRLFLSPPLSLWPSLFVHAVTPAAFKSSFQRSPSVVGMSRLFKICGQPSPISQCPCFPSQLVLLYASQTLAKAQDLTDTPAHRCMTCVRLTPSQSLSKPCQRAMPLPN
jgi:hypothetical protein